MVIFDKNLIKADFEKAASQYHQHSDLQQQVALSLISKAGKYINDGRNLDIGCGTGFVAKNTNWQNYQLDLAFSMCKMAGQYAPVINADMENLAFDDCVFNSITSSLALQWSVNPKSFFAESYRVLNVDSYAVITTFGQNTLKELRQLFEVVEGSSHVSAFLSADMLGNLAVAAGFEVVEIETEMMNLYYPDVRALLKNIKGVGASNKQSDRKRYFSKTTLQNLENIYNQTYLCDKGVKASWEIIYLVIKK